jgi:hypothetical protein
MVKKQRRENGEKKAVNKQFARLYLKRSFFLIRRLGQQMMDRTNGRFFICYVS